MLTPSTIPTAVNQPLTMVSDWTHTGLGTSCTSTALAAHSATITGLYYASANTREMYAGSSFLSGTAADGSEHNMIAVASGGSGTFYVDAGAPTTGSVGSTGFTTADQIKAFDEPSGPVGVASFVGSAGDFAIYPSAFSSGDATAVCHNSFLWYGGTLC
jgi:hypothetical protein